MWWETGLHFLLGIGRRWCFGVQYRYCYRESESGKEHESLPLTEPYGWMDVSCPKTSFLIPTNVSPIILCDTHFSLQSVPRPITLCLSFLPLETSLLHVYWNTNIIILSTQYLKYLHTDSQRNKLQWKALLSRGNIQVTMSLPHPNAVKVENFLIPARMLFLTPGSASSFITAWSQQTIHMKTLPPQPLLGGKVKKKSEYPLLPLQRILMIALFLSSE